MIQSIYDLDFLVPSDDQVCRSIYRLMKELGADVGTVEGPDAETAIKNRSERLMFGFGGWKVDLFREHTFAYLAARATEAELGGSKVKVINPHDLRRKKQARGSHKDRIDIEWLLQRFGREGPEQ